MSLPSMFATNHESTFATHASTSQHSQQLSRPIPPFQRQEVHAIKKELHDALGDDGLPYWKALNGFLLGQVGRSELECMVKSWLRGRKIQLHNRLLLALLSNASSPMPHSPLSASNTRKRNRVGIDDPEFDTDDTFIEPKARVKYWIKHFTHRERARLRKAIAEKAEEEDAEAEEVDAWDGEKKWSTYAPSTTMPPLAISARQLPSSHQLSHRLSQMAKLYDLNLAPDAAGNIGEFMAVGMDAHLGDLLHSVIQLTGRDRPGEDTIRVPRGVKREPDLIGMDVDDEEMQIKQEPGPDLPKPDLETFQHLFNLAPGLHSQASPAIYKLVTSLLLAEADYNSPIKMERKPSIPQTPGLTSATHPASPKKATTSNANRSDLVAQQLLDSGLLKLDKAARQSEAGEGEGGKKDRKHNLHWKYEDPAAILKDVLG